MPKPSVFLIELQYLPPIEYFAGICQHKTLLIEANETYQKQTYRNRCYINGANNIQALSIPVKKGSQQTVIKEIAINNKQSWAIEHWRSIQSAYGKAPFFEHYAPYLHPLYQQKPDNLFSFNLNILTICLQFLNFKKEIKFTSEFKKNYSDFSISDARSTILPSNRTLESPYFTNFTYHQVFGAEFVNNLSVIDLIFCLGPEAGNSLAQSVKNKKQTLE